MRTPCPGRPVSRAIPCTSPPSIPPGFSCPCTRAQTRPKARGQSLLPPDHYPLPPGPHGTPVVPVVQVPTKGAPWHGPEEQVRQEGLGAAADVLQVGQDIGTVLAAGL